MRLSHIRLFALGVTVFGMLVVLGPGRATTEAQTNHNVT